MSTAQPVNPRRPGLWKNRSFVRLFAAQTLSLLGSRMSLLILFESVLQRTGSAWDLGKAALLLSVPLVLLTPLAGAVADRWDRKRIVVVVAIGRCLLTAGYALAGELWHFYLLILGNACLETFSAPALFAFTSQVVDPDDLVSANSARVVSTNLVSILGPPAGAALYALTGAGPVFLVDAVTFLGAGILVATVRRGGSTPGPEPVPRPQPGRASGLRAFAADYREAWAFLRRRRAFLLFTLMETTLLAAFFAIQNTLGLVFIEQALGRTVVDASLFFGCLALGAALAGLVVSRLGGRLTDKLRLVGPALLVDGVLLAVFSLNTIFPLTVVLTVFLGVIGAIIDIVYVTIVQAEAPQDLQGKVFALRAFAIGVVAPVAIAVGAALADVVEIQWIFLACAVAEIGLALVLLGAMRAEERRSS